MGKGTSRKEHIAWCKTRALEFCKIGDVNQAWASMLSDMSKHLETSSHQGIELGTKLFVSGKLSNPMQMREFIEGLN